MTETTAQIVVPDSLAGLATLKFTPLKGVSTLNMCDRHLHVYAVVEIGRDDWLSSLLLCGNCARKCFGYEHTQNAPQENRQKGSAS
jgi:hypothetical protein